MKKRKINEICCVLPYVSHIGMCCPKGGVLAPFWLGISTLFILVSNGVWFSRDLAGRALRTYLFSNSK